MKPRSNQLLTFRIFALLTILAFSAAASAQKGAIAGKVTDVDTGEPLIGANVSVPGTSLGAAAGQDGGYLIENVPAGEREIRVSFIGYPSEIQQVTVLANETVTVNFQLSQSVLLGNTVVVSASRRPEKLTEAPATISVIDASDLARTTGFTYGEALKQAKGVDTYRTGIDGVTVNARGFMTAYSYRMQLMADGRNSMLPGAGPAAGQQLPVAREDVDRIETILGPSSALYGPNAHNGLVNIITKHPRDYPGLTVAVGGGENSIRTGRLRFARVIDDKFAFKINAEVMRGNDWVKNDTAGVDNNGQFYFENPDNNVENFRADAALYYLIATDLELVGAVGYSTTNSVSTTNVGRNQLVGWEYNYEQFRLNHPNFFIQAYRTGNNAGETHALENKVAAQVNAANAGQPISEEQAIEQVRFVDESERFNAEAQFNTTFSKFHFIAGVNYEDSRPVSSGTYLSDTLGNDLQIKQSGVYAQAEFEPGERLKLIAAGRYDRHDNYDSQFSPRIGAVYKIPGYGALRFTYNRAFQAPAIIQQELYLLFGLNASLGIPVRLRGNGHGFKIRTGDAIVNIDPLEPETNTTYEIGYSGFATKKLHIDFNAYHSKYKNFISPLNVIGISGAFPVPVLPTVLSQGEVTFSESASPELVLTYRNFGEVTMQGIDFGLQFQVSRKVGLWGNFSYVNPRDLDNAGNDFDMDGMVEPSELSFNTPENRFNLGLMLTDFLLPGLFASASMRHVDSYDFVSGSHSGTKDGEGSGLFQFKDRGPLGGFESIDVNLSYLLKSGVQFNLGVTNLLDKKLQEMVSSPAIRRLIVGEIKYTFQL